MTIANNINNKIEQVRLIDPTRKSEDIVRTSKYDGKIVVYLNDGTGIVRDKSGNLLQKGPISDSTFEIIKKSLEEAGKDESEKLEHNSRVAAEAREKEIKRY